MTDLASLLVGGGIASVIVALIGAIVNRRLNSANYAEVVSRISVELAEQVDKKNEKLESKVDSLELSVDGLKERVGELTDALREAINRLDGYGHDTDPLRKVLHRNGTGTGSQPH